MKLKSVVSSPSSLTASHNCLHTTCDVLILNNRTEKYCFNHIPTHNGIPVEGYFATFVGALKDKKDEYCWHRLVKCVEGTLVFILEVKIVYIFALIVHDKTHSLL